MVAPFPSFKQVPSLVAEFVRIRLGTGRAEFSRIRLPQSSPYPQQPADAGAEFSRIRLPESSPYPQQPATAGAEFSRIRLPESSPYPQQPADAGAEFSRIRLPALSLSAAAGWRAGRLDEQELLRCRALLQQVPGRRRHGHLLATWIDRAGIIDRLPERPAIDNLANFLARTNLPGDQLHFTQLDAIDGEPRLLAELDELCAAESCGPQRLDRFGLHGHPRHHGRQAGQLRPCTSTLPPGRSTR
jgi:hypothetical protein